MESIFKGKRILILGATAETIPLVKKAEELGVETFVADPFPNAHAKVFSSHPLNVDCFDIEALANIVRNNHIDGVLPGCADILVPVYFEICKLTNCPCYVNEEILKVFNNKKGLKEKLKEYGLDVIKEYSLEDINKPSFCDYPLFVKPVDNNSSKGMSIVYNPSEFHAAYEKAIGFSSSKTVLIEQYKNCDDFFVGFFLHDGIVSTTFSADRFVIRQHGFGSITAAMTYPSKYHNLFLNTAYNKLIAVFRDLDFKNGIIAIQGFVEDNKILFYDPALRITGGQEYFLTNYFYRLDILESLICFSIYGKMSLNNLEHTNIDASFNGCYACNLAVSVKKCKIGKIDGADYAKKHKNVLNVTQEHCVGDVIDKIGTAQQNVFRIHAVANNAEEMKRVIADLQENIIVYDENGANVILEGINPDQWFLETEKKI